MLYRNFLLVIYFMHKCIFASSIHKCIFAQSPNSTHLSFPTQCPYTCSPHLCLHFCFADRFIYTVFLDSTYVLIYSVFLSDISLCMAVCRSTHVSADGTIPFLFHDQVTLHCMYVHLPYPFLCGWMSRLPPGSSKD